MVRSNFRILNFSSYDHLLCSHIQKQYSTFQTLILVVNLAGALNIPMGFDSAHSNDLISINIFYYSNILICDNVCMKVFKISRTNNLNLKTQVHIV